MRTVTYDLKALLKLAQAGAFTIPLFQRDFVWREAQVKLLVDSVSRGFPIGSLLVLSEQSREKLSLASRPIEAVSRTWAADDGEESLPDPGAAESRSDRSYVLDGQQRLTSLVRVFLDAAKDKSYYVDLRRLIDQFSPNGGHVWKRRGATEQVWVRALKRKTPNPDRRERNRYLRCDLVLHREKCQVYVQEYFEDSEEFEGRFDRVTRRQAAAAVNSMFETIRNYQVPLVVIDPDSPLEAICRIFETINSTGTRLTTFDLAVARFYPEPDLRSMRNEIMQMSPTLSRFGVDGERILQVLALWSAQDKNSAPDITRTAVLTLEKSYIEEHWTQAASSLDEAYEWAESHGASTRAAPNDALLVALAAFLGRADKTWRQQVAFSTVLERWYFSKLLQGGARQATNYKMGTDFRTLMAWKTEGKLPQPEPVHLSESNLLELSPTDVRYRTLQALLSMRSRHDIRTGHPLQPRNVEDHHIFPDSLKRTHGLPRRRLDSICNRLFVSQDTNLHLSNRLPEDYMGEIAAEARKARVEGRVDQRLRDAAIPWSISEANFASRFALSEFETFLRERARAILVQVRDIIGDALITGMASADRNDDDTDDLDDE